MATQLQIRRGTSTQVAAFTGAEGEIVVNTTNDSVHVNDGSTAGGFELARADFNNISASATLTIGTLNTTNLDLTNLEVTNIKAKDGTAAGSIADSTGVVTLISSSLTTADITTLKIGGTAVTSTAAELNILDGVTSTAAELNILDGVTATTAELNYVDGVTSAIQTQIDAKAPIASPTFTGSVTANPSGGVVTLGANGHITSKQSLDVITAGGRYLGSSNRGLLGQLRIEQTAQGADGGYVALDTCAVGSTSPTERMRIDSGGNVGIGETLPEGLMHIKKGNSGTTYSADAADQLILENSGSVLMDIRTPTGNTGGILFSDADARGRGVIQYAHGNDTLYINTAGAERMTISGAGVTLTTVASGGGNADLRYHTGTGVVSYDTSSQQFKDNIRDNTTYGLTAVNALQSRMFEYKDDGRTDVGLVAEEVVEVVPELVGLDSEGNPLTVDYKRFVSVLIKAIQEQQTLIESLTDRIAALENN